MRVGPHGHEIGGAPVVAHRFTRHGPVYPGYLSPHSAGPDETCLCQDGGRVMTNNRSAGLSDSPF